MKSVERSDISDNELQTYASCQYSNASESNLTCCTELVQLIRRLPIIAHIIEGSLCYTRLQTELKHISKSRNRNQIEIPPVAASEKGRANPELQLWERCVIWTKCPRMGQAER